MPDNQLQTVPDDLAVPSMTVGQAMAVRNQLVGLMQQVLRKDVDYGEIPGTSGKPALFKSGAEVLCSVYGLAPVFTIVDRVERWDVENPFFRYIVCCELYRGEHRMGQAHAEINSFESRYRYRWVREADLPGHVKKEDCPTRGGKMTEFDFAIDKKETTGQYGKPMSYWWDLEKQITDGLAKKVTKKVRSGKEYDAWEFDTLLYRIPNDDIFSQVNTLIKMVEKRALVAATLIVTGASALFTQDVEESQWDYDPERGEVLEGVYTVNETPNPPAQVTSPSVVSPSPVPEKPKEKEQKPAQAVTDRPLAEQKAQEMLLSWANDTYGMDTETVTVILSDLLIGEGQEAPFTLQDIPWSLKECQKQIEAVSSHWAAKTSQKGNLGIRFWQWVRSLDIPDAKALELLGNVPHLYAYTGTQKQAVALVQAWHDQNNKSSEFRQRLIDQEIPL